MREPLLALLSTWLKEPQGYCMDVLVRANGELSALSLNRLLADMFGEFPHTVRCLDAQTSDPAVPGEIHNCRHVTQSLPAIFPEPTLLPALGVSRLYALPQRLSANGISIGTVGEGAHTAVVRLPDAERTSHMACFGAPGSGKSTFLLKMLEQDMAASDGRSVILIDPHGTLCDDGLALVPHSRIQDVICVDVDATAMLVSINPFAGTKNNPHKTNFMANEIVSLIDALFEEHNTSGPGSRNYLKLLFKLIPWIPERDCTFLDALRLLEDRDFMEYLETKCKDRVVLEQLANFKKQTGDQSFVNWASYLTPKLAPFASSPVMRRMLSNPNPGLNLAKEMRDGRIIFFNLNQATLGAVETRIFGNLVLNQIFYAATQRGDIRTHGGRPFHLVVDEAASLCTASMLPMWAQARKYGLSITTANQNVAQLRDRNGGQPLSEGILANTATKVFFRLGAPDAERLAPYIRPYGTADMVELPTFHAAVNMLADGEPVPTFVMKVHRPQPQPGVHAQREDVVTQSLQRHGVPMGQVVELMCRAFDLQPGDVGPRVPEEFSAPTITQPAVPEQRHAMNFLNRLQKDSATPSAIVSQKGSPAARVHSAWVDALQSTPGFVYPDDLRPLSDPLLIDVRVTNVPARDELLAALSEHPGIDTRTRKLLVQSLLKVDDSAWEIVSESA